MSAAPAHGESPPIAYRVTLRAGRERSVQRRHPWVFSGAIDLVEGRPEAQPGDLGQLVSADGELLGTATVNPQAGLVARILRFGEGPIDQSWMTARVRRALDLRRALLPPATTAYRWINAEGDGLAGLIVDRYGPWLVVQCLSAGVARLERLWLPALVGGDEVRGVLERAPRAAPEPHLSRSDGLLWGEAPPERVEILEVGHRFAVDLRAGQKTGFFLDQRENRQRLSTLGRGRRVLDAFAYTGAFSVWLGAAGARQVVAVESSPAALRLAEANWALNDLPPDRLELVRASVPGFLRRERRQFDLIVLDPPGFAKERGHLRRAARAYKDVNLHALRLLAPGGYLATFSCSQHVGVDLFQKIVFGAALDAGVPLQWIARLGAGSDHPVHLDHPQGEYLTGLLLRSLAGE